MLLTRSAGASLSQQVYSILQKYGTDAHLYLPGIGVINGLTSGNYLDSAGTTAATVDNPVGLVLDANGSVGSELVTNGTFDTDVAGWSIVAPATITWNSGKAEVSRAGGAIQNLPYQDILTVGKTYVVEITISALSHQAYVVGWTADFVITAIGSYRFIAKSGSTRLQVQAAGNINATYTMDNISVKEVTGIHALQATTANKPILRKGVVNYLLQSSNLLNSPWLILTGGTRAANSYTFSAAAGSGIGASATIYEGTASKTITVAAKVSCSSGTVPFRLKNTHGGVIDNFSGELLATTTPTIFVYTVTNGASVGNGTQVFGILNSAVTPVVNTLNIEVCGVFVGSYTASELEAKSALTPTTTAAASSPTGNYHWVHDSTDVLTATFPAGYESATIINTAETGQVTYTGQNIVGAYDMRGAVIGSELIVNGDFSSAAGWTLSPAADARFQITGGKLVATNALNGDFASQASLLTVGKSYRISFTIDSISAGTVRFNDGVTGFLPQTTAGTFSGVIVATGTSARLTCVGTTTATVDNFSVREITAKEYGRFIFRTGLTASELVTMQTFANRLAGV